MQKKQKKTARSFIFMRNLLFYFAAVQCSAVPCHNGLLSQKRWKVKMPNYERLRDRKEPVCTSSFEKAVSAPSSGIKNSLPCEHSHVTLQLCQGGLWFSIVIVSWKYIEINFCPKASAIVQNNLKFIDKICWKNYGSSNVCQIISVMKTQTMVFPEK